jgi:hypothetical protein
MNKPETLTKEVGLTRQDVLDQVKQAFGLIPEWLKTMPEGALQQFWATLNWVLDDTDLPSRDKVLVAYGAATAIHCSY